MSFIEQRQKRIKINTFTNDEYFKIAIVSKTEQEAIENSVWVSGHKGKLIREDLIRAPYKDTHIICYPRFIGDIRRTIHHFEVVAIFVEDEETFISIKEDINLNYEKLNIRLLVSNHPNAEDWAKELKSGLVERKDREEVVIALDQLDQEEFKYIVKKFIAIDTDKSGSISTSEMPKLIESLGVFNVTEGDIKDAILVFDTNRDGLLSMDEFIIWWKIGRKDPTTFLKFHDLDIYVQQKMNSIFNVPELEKIKNNQVINNSTKLTITDIDLDTLNLESYTTRVNVKAAVGGKARSDACKNYLSRYNNKMDFNEDYFIDFAIFVQSGTIGGFSAKDYILKFKDDLIDEIDRTMIPGFKDFIGNFLVVKVFNQEYSVNIRFEFKYDIQELLKSSLNSYLKFSSWLTKNGKFPLDFEAKFFSGKNLNDLIDDDCSFGDFFDQCEFLLKFKSLKEKIRSIIDNLHDENYDYNFNKILHTLSRMTFKVKYRGKINTYTDSFTKEILNSKFKLFRDAINHLKSNVPQELRQNMSRIEVACNIVDTFASVQIFSENQWKDNNFKTSN